MHSMTVCPRETVYALPCLGCRGCQAGLASFVEKGVEPPPMPRHQAAWLLGMSPVEYRAQHFRSVYLDTCCSCRPRD